ncbi:MAG: D-alanyl-D-alanine carboxypeptidase family protein [Roseburia sp.]|nr:D-alanyl-D-alanine carboxypeptidase family protein [Roseburia sp.]
MKKTLEERIKSRCIKFGRKNRLCSILIVPVLVVSMFFLHACRYLRDNTKRLAMASMAFCLFTVYSSFSFPMFISENGQRSMFDEMLDASGRTVTLAQEEVLDLENVEILEDEDVIEDGEYDEASHGLTIIDKYEADEILSSIRNRYPDNDGKQETEPEDIREYCFSPDDWRLVLINKQHSIPEDYSFTFGTINTLKGKMQCDERIIDDLSDMLTAAKEEDIHLTICSPYRDLEYQKMLFNRKINRYLKKGMSYVEAYRLSSQVVTVPGASEHQLGLALDIVCSSYLDLDEGFSETPAGIWLAQNSYKYGFILRYPKGKEAITGIDYEPWHFRYVGVEAATVMTQEELTLEEFWEEYL